MTDEQKREICEQISSWFEPKPSVLGPATGVLHYWEWAEAYWPLDYFTSESANARLLEAMPFPTMFKSCAFTDQGAEWVCHPFGTTRVEESHADRKTAVVLAFCRFAKIEFAKQY